jgi:hypothetical protein
VAGNVIKAGDIMDGIVDNKADAATLERIQFDQLIVATIY